MPLSDAPVRPTMDTPRASDNSPASAGSTISENTTARRAFVWFVYLATFGLLGWFFFAGLSYYLTPLADRPYHQDYRALRPAGTIGLLYGYAGALMMILMLVYTLRKRTGMLGKKTTLSSMLNIHIYLGIVGPLLIVLHTSFKVQGLVAVSFWSMVAVALSGFFGRYLYKQIPRNVQGAELTLTEMERLSAEQASALQARFQLSADGLSRLEMITDRFAAHFSGNALTAVLFLLFDDLFRFWSRLRFASAIRKAVPLQHRELKAFTDQAFTRALLKRRIGLLNQVHQLFHYWHVIHKPFAIIMYIIMVVHIGVAIWTGFGWPW